MPLVLKGLLLTVMVELAVLPPPLLAPRASCADCAEARGWLGCPTRWLM